MQPETIDLKPIGFLNPARRPIAQTGQHGLSLITKMQFVAAGPIWSRVSTNETDETKHEKAYISTKPSRMFELLSTCSGFESSACDPTRCAREAGIHNACREQSSCHSMAKSLTGNRESGNACGMNKQLERAAK
jgi:hypothetical protein